MMMNNLLAYSSQQAAAQMFNGYGNIPLPSPAGSTQHQPVNVSLKSLPFYDVHASLVTPTALVTRGPNRFQTASFQFQLSVEQANQIALNRDLRQSAKVNHTYQIQLRFCVLDPSTVQSDEFPPSICVEVNGKMCPLPNPIPTNKPNAEAKRPPKPVDITPLCKLNPALSNTIHVKWTMDHGKNWVMAINLVEKLTSDQLLTRLKEKGTKQKEFTQEMIRKQLEDDGDDIATTDIKVSLACPLGKMRMSTPCRPSTCDHLQCFDANLFINMNERKPTWTCPVCNKQARYEDLYLDGYFLDVVNSKDLPDEENEIILNQDGTWKPLPREEQSEEDRQRQEEEEERQFSGGASGSGQSADVECIDID